MHKNEIIDFFDKCSEFWDENMITCDDKMNEIMDAAGIGAGAGVLDIACGTGVMFDYYLKRGVLNITGVDISEKMIKIARKKFAKNSRINLICGDADTISFKDTFDCCVVFNAFPHFINPEGLIRNLKNCIKTQGSLTIAHDNGRRAIDNHHSGEAHSVSRHLMSEDDLERLFVKCNFRVTTKKATDDIYIVSGIKLN